jgi:hypothetical protein
MERTSYNEDEISAEIYEGDVLLEDASKYHVFAMSESVALDWRRKLISRFGNDESGDNAAVYRFFMAVAMIMWLKVKNGKRSMWRMNEEYQESLLTHRRFYNDSREGLRAAELYFRAGVLMTAVLSDVSPASDLMDVIDVMLEEKAGTYGIDAVATAKIRCSYVEYDTNM